MLKIRTMVAGVNGKPSYVSLFSGGGVGGYGLSLEGYDCVATSELVGKRLAVQRHNGICLSDEGYISGDITDESVKARIYDRVREWSRINQDREIDMVIATPPCQGISVANHKKSDELGRNSLVIESLKIVSDILPKYFVIENVRSFLTAECLDADGAKKPIGQAIYGNLAGRYNIGTRVINFKDYGGSSSRTRTLVIGVRKDIEEVTPYALFPDRKEAPTLRQLIGDLPRLKKMGEVCQDDIYHFFRPYEERMHSWIADLGEGESAFDNEDPAKRPHRLVGGVAVENKRKNGDKYRRCLWDKSAPCVHTRNDILSSQSTIHPEDPRVFSIRELMRLMDVPDSFRWSGVDMATLNGYTEHGKKVFLKANELNIRQCLGEAVPTSIFRSIAKKIAKLENSKAPSGRQVRRIIEKENLQKLPNLVGYLENNTLSFVEASKLVELSNARRLSNAAYYTRQDLCFNLVYDLPDFKHIKTLRILEPSVGVGNFLPALFARYSENRAVVLDLFDIDGDSLMLLRQVLKTVSVPDNFKINFINDDFLKHDFEARYDLIVGNPPFGKLQVEKYREYQAGGLQSRIGTKNVCALFIEKALKIGSTVALFSPKSILGAPEFEGLRDYMNRFPIVKINDYGESGFRDVKIETVSFQIDKLSAREFTTIESHILNSYVKKRQDYIADRQFPGWLIYRNDSFDEIARGLNLGVFSVLRDRSVTSRVTKNEGSIRVVKSKNIAPGHIKYLDTDVYVDGVETSSIARRYYNRPGAIVAPNLSYYPRAAFLPKGVLVDGSAAVLMQKRAFSHDVRDLSFFSSKAFFVFYRIARNFATRSLNIDSNSVYYWGLPKQAGMHHEPMPSGGVRSKLLFVTDAAAIAS